MARKKEYKLKPESISLKLPTIKLGEKLKIQTDADKKTKDYLSEYVRRAKPAGS